MNASEKKRLSAAGWRVGRAAEFLELSPEEAVLVDLKIALADLMKALRARHRWTQGEVAERCGSSQSRIAKMEAADASVSIDLLMRCLVTLGATRNEIARVIAARAA